jgi:hypothetical protein
VGAGKPGTRPTKGLEKTTDSASTGSTVRPGPRTLDATAPHPSHQGWGPRSSQPPSSLALISARGRRCAGVTTADLMSHRFSLGSAMGERSIGNATPREAARLDAGFTVLEFDDTQCANLSSDGPPDRSRLARLGGSRFRFRSDTNARLPIRRRLVDMLSVTLRIPSFPPADEVRILTVGRIGDMPNANRNGRWYCLTQNQSVLCRKPWELSEDIPRRQWSRGANEFLICNAHRPMCDDRSTLRQYRRNRLMPSNFLSPRRPRPSLPDRPSAP